MLTKNHKAKKAWLLLGLFAIGASVIVPASAQAQSARDMANRLSRIENEIETLNRAVYRGETPPTSTFSADPAASAAAEVRIQQLEGELRDIRGTLEEQNYQLRQMNEKLERSLSDMELRLGDLEAGRGSAPQQAAPYTSNNSSNGGSGMKTLQPSQGGSETSGNSNDFTWSSSGQGNSADAGQLAGGTGDAAASAYENAFSLLKNSNYEAAGQGFEKFIAQYPDHALVGNAQYWLGETYYVRGQYESAARIFAEGYQQFPNGAKAADNLLKLSMSLGAMGSTADACVALAQLKKEFSSGVGPVLRRADQEASRLNCQI